jgi:hypothetical protein
VFNNFVPGVPLYPEEGRNKFLQNIGLIYQTTRCHIPEDLPYNTAMGLSNSTRGFYFIALVCDYNFLASVT